MRLLKVYKNEGGRFKYYIVGSGPDKDYLKELVADCGLQNEIEFTKKIKKLNKFIS